MFIKAQKINTSDKIEFNFKNIRLPKESDYFVEDYSLAPFNSPNAWCYFVEDGANDEAIDPVMGNSFDCGDTVDLMGVIEVENELVKGVHYTLSGKSDRSIDCVAVNKHELLITKKLSSWFGYDGITRDEYSNFVEETFNSFREEFVY